MSPPADREYLFKTWLEEHRGIVVKVTRSFAPVPADAADLRQEMLLQLWTSLSSYAGQAKPSTWIYRVCLNTALTWRRGTSRRTRHLEPEADIALLSTEAASPADRAGEEELLDKLYAAIHALPMFDRALMLLALDGWPLSRDRRDHRTDGKPCRRFADAGAPTPRRTSERSDP